MPQGVRSAPTAGFSVVLPAYDEEGGLTATLDAVHAALAGCARPHEIVVVDDGSTDATPRLLAGRADVTVIRHGRNRGYGAALKAGIAAARQPLVVVMDADGTYPAAAIPALVEQCATRDMVVGARIGRHVQPARLRDAAKWCFRQFAQWITFTRIPDLNSGLRVFQRGLAERFLDVLPDGFSFTTTITVASLLEGYRVAFEPVDYMPRIGHSKVRPLRDTWRIARQLLRLGLRFAPWRTALAFALPLLGLGLAGVLLRRAAGAAIAASDVIALAAAALLAIAGAAAERRVRRRRDLAGDPLVTSRGRA
jgi:glycosyltransferase involved in cell wall biosynthesis